LATESTFKGPSISIPPRSFGPGHLLLQPGISVSGYVIRPATPTGSLLLIELPTIHHVRSPAISAVSVSPNGILKHRALLPLSAVCSLAATVLPDRHLRARLLSTLLSLPAPILPLWYSLWPRLWTRLLGTLPAPILPLRHLLRLWTRLLNSLRPLPLRHLRGLGAGLLGTLPAPILPLRHLLRLWTRLLNSLRPLPLRHLLWLRTGLLSTLRWTENLLSSAASVTSTLHWGWAPAPRSTTIASSMAAAVASALGKQTGPRPYREGPEYDQKRR